MNNTAERWTLAGVGWSFDTYCDMKWWLGLAALRVCNTFYVQYWGLIETLIVNRSNFKPAHCTMAQICPQMFVCKNRESTNNHQWGKIYIWHRIYRRAVLWHDADHMLGVLQILMVKRSLNNCEGLFASAFGMCNFSWNQKLPKQSRYSFKC